MAKKGSYIVDYFNNRGFFGLSILLLVIFSVIASGNFVVPQRGYGTFHNLATWISSSDTSCFVAVVCNMVIGILLVTLNIMFRYIKTYNCFVFAAIFVLLQGINPFLSTRFFAGTALCLVVVMSLFFMFEQYGKRGGATQGIFLVMALLSFFTIYHYVFFLLIPLFLLGFAYMRVLDIRGVFATIFGIVTPYWIMLGTGLESISAFQAPHISQVWESAPAFGAKGWAITVAISTVAVTVLLTISNLKTMLNYSVHVRAYNNFFVALSVFVVLMMAIDYNDFLIYMPLLNMCFAIQYGHWYVIMPHETRQPVTIWLLVALFTAFIIAMVIA
jgi:hypothetical protein